MDKSKRYISNEVFLDAFLLFPQIKKQILMCCLFRLHPYPCLCVIWAVLFSYKSYCNGFFVLHLSSDILLLFGKMSKQILQAVIRQQGRNISRIFDNFQSLSIKYNERMLFETHARKARLSHQRRKAEPSCRFHQRTFAILTRMLYLYPVL